MTGNLLKPKEVAERLRISIRLVYQLIERGDLEGIRIGNGRGRAVRVVESSLNKLIEAGRTNATN